VTSPTGSYLEVSYDLRPAKQVERRMIIDVLQRMTAAGFQIRDYQYTGLGSIYFVDFILFHRLLGLQRLLSVEHDARIEKRIEFNRPFGLVETQLMPIGDVIPTLGTEQKHLLWLDYDYVLDQGMVIDTTNAAYHLSAGSVLLITVDLKQPAGHESPAACMEYYKDEAGGYFEAGWSGDDFTQSALPMTVSRILMNAIRNGTSGRSGVRCFSLFRFLYQDGAHPMLTIGGLIGADGEKSQLDRCDFSDIDFVRRDDTSPPYRIVVPRLTRKERIYLDQFMPCAAGWVPDDFELSREEALHYRSIYRYNPWYAELLL
jgi:hypothetical protein